MVLLLTVIVSSLILGTLGQSCEEKYKRYSFNHALCLPKNTSCQIVKSQMSDAMKIEVLDYHNRYRSYIAQGLEKRARGMPPAANMLQMVWDNELAVIVRKHLEQCSLGNDCTECRQVPNFFVGQTIVNWRIYNTPSFDTLDLFKSIQAMYNQIVTYDRDYVDSYSDPEALEISPENRYKALTQMIWAKTWRVGCDYVVFRTNDGYETLVGCNYGPGGNKIGEPVYKTGAPCSYCPENSCCGSSCSVYEGLCKLQDEGKPPRYPPPPKSIQYCDFREDGNHCGRGWDGPGWTYFHNALGGSYAEVVLNGGQRSILDFHYTIKPTDIVKEYCYVIWYRSGPHLSGEGFNNEAVLSFKSNNIVDTETLPSKKHAIDYHEHRIQRQYRAEVRVTLTFSAPPSANKQFFNIKLINVFNGTCW